MGELWRYSCSMGILYTRKVIIIMGEYGSRCARAGVAESHVCLIFLVDKKWQWHWDKVNIGMGV